MELSTWLPPRRTAGRNWMPCAASWSRQRNFSWDIAFGQLIPLILVLLGGGWGMVKLGFHFRGEIFTINGRISTLAEGALKVENELKAHKDYADKHFVEVGDLAEVRTGFQTSMTELRGDMREAIGTMGDVRDSVIRVEAKLFPDNPKSVPPARRRTAKAT